MTAPRLHPFEQVFGQFRDIRFPAIRDALNPPDAGLNEFVLAGPAIELMRDLRPAEGLGDEVDDFVSLFHAVYRFWLDGEHTVTLDQQATLALVAGRPTPGAATPGRSVTRYIQIAPRCIWAAVAPDAAHEPLDGWFAVPDLPALRVVGCLGVHAERPGLSVIAAAGVRPALTRRADGTALFAPTMPGGARAGLRAIVTLEELLLLGWRAQDE